MTHLFLQMKPQLEQCREPLCLKVLNTENSLEEMYPGTAQQSFYCRC